MKINLEPNKKVYFASDQHFGAPNPKESKVREEKFIRWLDEIKADAQVLFLMGDDLREAARFRPARHQ